MGKNMRAPKYLSGGRTVRRKKRSHKLVVMFDEKAREQFLTGFRKRKNERRKEHFFNTAAKQRKDLVAKRKALRAEKKEKVERNIAGSGLLELEQQLAEGEKRGADASAEPRETAEYEDDFTANAFGASTVEVTTSFGFVASEDEESDAGDQGDDAIVEVEVRGDDSGAEEGVAEPAPKRPQAEEAETHEDIWASDEETLLASLRKQYGMDKAAGAAQTAPKQKTYQKAKRKRGKGRGGRGSSWQADAKTKRGARGWKAARAKRGQRAKGRR
jgi:ribosomal RNA-processing protein 17